jgi:hypothetical protein
VNEKGSMIAEIGDCARDLPYVDFERKLRKSNGIHEIYNFIEKSVSICR